MELDSFEEEMKHREQIEEKIKASFETKLEPIEEKIKTQEQVDEEIKASFEKERMQMGEQLEKWDREREWAKTDMKAHPLLARRGDGAEELSCRQDGSGDEVPLPQEVGERVPHEDERDPRDEEADG